MSFEAWFGLGILATIVLVLLVLWRDAVWPRIKSDWKAKFCEANPDE